MKNLFLIILPVFCFSVSARGQERIIRNSAVTGVCYAGTRVKRMYIPPPSRFYARGLKSGGDITVIYTGFTAAATAAFDYAVSILESVLPADAKLTISASWEKLTTSGVLANTSISAFAAGWGINAYNPLAYYPVALAEKIAGQDINGPGQPDLVMKVNSSITWYLGTDGNTPPTQYDLVTVALHEICHGLGFFDSMNADNSVGSYGLGSLPVVYDGFVENASGQKFLDTLTFRNNSSELYQQMISGQVWFNGPLVKNFLSGSRVKLYSPSKWESGSSISHLDEDANSDFPLMTPFIDLGEAVHNPGRLTLSILGDLGWINTRITHKPMGDTEEFLSQVTLTADISSDTTYNKDRVSVVYSFDDFTTSDTLFMIPSGVQNQYKATVAIPAYNKDLQYYFYTVDCFNRIYKAPSLVQVMRYASYIGKDTIKPIMQHTPLSWCLQTTDSLKFNALAADNIGIDSLYLEYRVNSGNSGFVKFSRKDKQSFSTFLEMKSLHANGGDSIHYRIFAVDSARVSNVSVLPENGFYSFPVEKIESVVESYSTDFSNAAGDFFNIGFSITRPIGFEKPGLHTKHPYESPEVDNGSIEYVALLRHPVRFDASGLLMTFNEIVLIEPGESGSVFGSSDFYDYVVVEASADFGRSWFPLENGYDSRSYKLWETDYNSAVVNNNSTFSGNESLLKEHKIYYKPSSDLAAGDTALIRFRLYSDPYANGWGWGIEELKINALINSVSIVKESPVLAYPNPGNGIIRLTDDSDFFNGNQVTYSIFNSSGVCLIDKMKSDGRGIINISSLQRGMYLIVLESGNRKIVVRYNLIR